MGKIPGIVTSLFNMTTLATYEKYATRFADVMVVLAVSEHSIILFVRSPKFCVKHCFQFLLGLTMVRRENKNKAYSKFGVTNKGYYGVFRLIQLILRVF